MAVLEVKKIKKSFGGLDVLKDVSFSLEEGQVLTIIGSSGSGKTTLLRCLNFLETADEGQILVNGKLLTGSHLTEEQIRENRLHFGLVFQNFNLFPQYTVLQNITLAPTLLKQGSQEEIQKKAMELLDKVGLTQKKDAYPCQLSGGQQQRVAIARALAKNPKLLLCDEPTGALDYVTGKSILKLLQDTCRQTGKTVIVITHNTALTAMADRVIRVKSGQIVGNEVNPSPTPVELIEW